MTEETHLGIIDQAKTLYRSAKKGVSTDGCTAVPDFDFGADCCAQHDYHYHAQDISRKEADKKLRQCIQAKGYIVLPWLYWLGVRVFGRGAWDKHQQ
jgi:hypothetical protein